MKKKIFIFRHGQTDKNVARIWQGASIDVELNETGKQQAQQLASKLKDKGITRIYTSNLIRAKQTAEIVSQMGEKNVPIDIILKLHEINFGECEGLTDAEVRQKYSNEFINKFLWPDDKSAFLSFKNGENKQHAFNRFMGCLRYIIMGFDSTVGVVSHGGMMSALAYGLNLKNVTCENCSVICLEYDTNTKNFSQVLDY